MSGRTVLVTGAGGFLGRHVSAAFAAAGDRVRGAVRSPGAALAPGVEAALVPDLLDRAAVRAAVQGVDAVVHLAARVHVMRDTSADPLAEFRRVNVEGTRVLLEEASAAGVRDFVLASSVKAVGEGGEAPYDERTPAAPQDPYGVSKLEAERLVLDAAPGDGMRRVVLRLPLVYGPGVRANMLSLFRLVDRGLPLPLGAVRNRRSLAYTGNVAAAFRHVVACDAADGQAFFVSDGADVSTPELIRHVASALGRPARLVPVPQGAFRAAGRAGDLLARMLPFPLTTAAVHRLLGSLAVDSSGLARVTGFAPPFTMAQGMSDTAAWFRAEAPGKEGR